MSLVDSLSLILVTDDLLLRERDPISVCSAAVRGGVTMVQLRLKLASDRDLLDMARRMVIALPVPVIVNDRVDVALLAGAAGVHLGTDDLSPFLARRIVPPGFIVGASVGTIDEVKRGEAADYWGIGPLRSTITKSDAGAALGWGGVSEILALAKGKACVVIGGVLPEDVMKAKSVGCAGVAVVRGVLKHEDIEMAARRFRE